MRGRSFMILLVLVLLSGGCAKKNTRVTPTPTPPTPPAPASTSPPPAAPIPTPAPVSDPLAGDLDTVNRYIQESGLLADVLFDYDRHELRPDARQQLEENARFLKEHPQFRVVLEGHADERGTIEYNLALGQKRATSARSYLDLMGISHDRLSATSYGKERPLCSEGSESCWRRNRRVHFEIVERIE